MADQPMPSPAYIRQRAEALRAQLQHTNDKSSDHALQLRQTIDYLEERAARIEAAIAATENSMA